MLLSSLTFNKELSFVMCALGLSHKKTLPYIETLPYCFTNLIRYADDRDLFTNLNFTIRAGTKVALVGASGSGFDHRRLSFANL